ncbi:hypothetical protein Xtri_14405 [Xanthomonas campestris pv. trichodesmae]|nr:hypothetical protein [Xanthomonas campestris pv. trichodesmae]
MYVLLKLRMKMHDQSVRIEFHHHLTNLMSEVASKIESEVAAQLIRVVQCEYPGDRVVADEIAFDVFANTAMAMEDLPCRWIVD